jgi:hypothetical protein
MVRRGALLVWHLAKPSRYRLPIANFGRGAIPTRLETACRRSTCQRQIRSSGALAHGGRTTHFPGCDPMFVTMRTAEGDYGARESTLAHVDGADEMSFEMSGDIWDIVDGRAVSRDTGSWAMVAYVRETWPLLRDASWHGDVLHGQWNGSTVEVAIDCPLCGEQHHHGGSLDDGRCHGHRVAHCHNQPTTPRQRDEFELGGYILFDARRYRVVSRRRAQAFRLHGTWPGDRDPAVEAAQDAVARRDLERARRLLDDVGLPPAAVRVLYEDMGLGAGGKVAVIKAVAAHPQASSQILSVIAGNGPESAKRYLASNPRLDPGLANQLVGDRASASATQHALAANPAVTADTLGWLTEIATGFRGYGAESRDPEFGKRILRHPHVDQEVVGYLAAIPELAGPILRHPLSDAGTADTVFEASIEQFHEGAQLTFLRSEFADAHYAARLMGEGSEAAAKEAARVIASRWPEQIDYLGLDDWSRDELLEIVGDSEAPQAIPEAAPTLYRHFNATGELLYVGRTIRPVLQRQHEHLKTKKWWNEVTLTNYERFSTVEELMTAELDAIRSEHPRYNLTHNGRRDH